MKIAIVTPFCWPVNEFYEGYAGKMVKILKNAGQDVTVICSDVYPDGKRIKVKEETKEGIKIKRYKNYLNLFYFAKVFFPDVRGYDVIHCCGGYRHPHVFYAFITKGKAKFLLSPFFPAYKRASIKGIFVNILMNFIDLTIGNPLIRNSYCLAETSLEAKWLKNLGTKNIAIIPAPLEDICFKKIKSSFREKYKLKGNVILWLGRHHQVKNLGELIRAAQYVDATFVFGGKESDVTKQWKSLAEKLNVENKIVWLNKDLDTKERLEAYVACNLFVLPSIKEGLGAVMIEAMAQKKPVIATSTGGLPAIVPDNFCLYNLGDVQTLASKINIILKDKRLASKIGKSGYEKAKQYRFSKVSKDYLSLLKNLK
ncbi:MAG: glycosyltransferase family 4 protein [Nanoarchaeota archaeon]